MARAESIKCWDAKLWGWKTGSNINCRKKIKKKLHKAELRKREEELITRVTNVAAPPTIPHLHLRVQGGRLGRCWRCCGCETCSRRPLMVPVHPDPPRIVCPAWNPKDWLISCDGPLLWLSLESHIGIKVCSRTFADPPFVGVINTFQWAIHHLDFVASLGMT